MYNTCTMYNRISTANTYFPFQEKNNVITAFFSNERYSEILIILKQEYKRETLALLTSLNSTVFLNQDSSTVNSCDIGIEKLLNDTHTLNTRQLFGTVNVAKLSMFADQPETLMYYLSACLALQKTSVLKLSRTMKVMKCTFTTPF